MSKKSPALTKGTLAYFKSVTWQNLQTRTINGKRPAKNGDAARYVKRGIKLKFSKEEFYNWCETQKTIILELYSQNKTPSLDRIDSNGHYEFNNIRIIDLDINRLNGLKIGRPLSSGEKRRLPILAISSNGEEIAADSITTMAKILKIDASGIVKVLKGKYQKRSGYTFKYITIGQHHE